MQDFDRTGGNRDSTLGGHTQSSVLIRTQGEGAVTPQETEQTYLLVLEGLLQRRGWRAVAHHEDKIQAAEVLGSTPWHEPSQSPPLAPPKSL